MFPGSTTNLIRRESVLGLEWKKATLFKLKLKTNLSKTKKLRKKMEVVQRMRKSTKI